MLYSLEWSIFVLPWKLLESSYNYGRGHCPNSSTPFIECPILNFRESPLHRRSSPLECQGEAGRRGSRGCQASPMKDTTGEALLMNTEEASQKKDTGEGVHLLILPTTGKGTSIGEGGLIQRGRGIFRGFLKMWRPLESQGTS